MDDCCRHGKPYYRLTEEHSGWDPSPSGESCACVCLWIWRGRCARGDIPGRRKSTECQVSHKVGLCCLLVYLEYANRAFVRLSPGSFKVEPSGNTAHRYLSVLCMDWRWIGVAAQRLTNVKKIDSINDLSVLNIMNLERKIKNQW